MLTSLPYHDEPVRVPADDQFTVRLRGLSPQQLLDAMTFVAFWSPGTFTAALDYCEATDWGWSGFDPDQGPGPDDDDNPDDSPAPVCARCGGNLGIFLKFGLDWRHYRVERRRPGRPRTLRPGPRPRDHLARSRLTSHPRLPAPHGPLTRRSQPAAASPGRADRGPGSRRYYHGVEYHGRITL